MILLTGYASKKELKSAIGTKLAYQETSVFGPEFIPDGVIYAAHRPILKVHPVGREFFAAITMKAGLIDKVD